MLLVSICNALAQGLIKPWIPGIFDNKPVKESPSPKAGKKRAVKAPAAQAKSKVSLSSVFFEDIPDVRKAIDVSGDSCISFTAYRSPSTLVSFWTIICSLLYHCFLNGTVLKPL